MTLLIDSLTLPKNHTIETEVCIIGAGAAGITLAREFANQKFRVCFLESGGLEFEEDSQSLYEGENIGHSYIPLDLCRLRFFGGSTNHWGGGCWPFDKIDFEKREWIPYSGWPFDKKHLNSYYKRAQKIIQLGQYDYSSEAWEDSEKRPKLPFDAGIVVSKVTQINPLLFGEIYRDEIARATNIETFLHANVVDIETDETGQNIIRLNVTSLESNNFSVSAKVFILCAGGIENPRLLLLSDKIQKTGLGNENDLVGRFFMEHLEFWSGVVRFSDPNIITTLYSAHSVNNTLIRAALKISDETQRRKKLINASLYLSSPVENRSESFINATASKGYKSLVQIYKHLRKGSWPDNFAKNLGNMLADIDDVAIAGYKTLFKSKSRTKMYWLENNMEQTPDPESRVTLSNEQDALGQRTIQLNWKLSPIQIQNLRRSHEILGQELGRLGLGRIQITLNDESYAWLNRVKGQAHHMGTTRMHVDPKQGVVDENCKVHGLSNLYVAGSSVFPTSGRTNPTLTIVALAARLADHIKEIMS